MCVGQTPGGDWFFFLLLLLGSNAVWCVWECFQPVPGRGAGLAMVAGWLFTSLVTQWRKRPGRIWTTSPTRLLGAPKSGRATSAETVTFGGGVGRLTAAGCSFTSLVRVPVRQEFQSAEPSALAWGCGSVGDGDDLDLAHSAAAVARCCCFWGCFSSGRHWRGARILAEATKHADHRTL